VLAGLNYVKLLISLGLAQQGSTNNVKSMRNTKPWPTGVGNCSAMFTPLHQFPAGPVADFMSCITGATFGSAWLLTQVITCVATAACHAS
jgi:hypothetical protein